MPKFRIVSAAALAGSAVLLFAGPASAHVTVEPKQADKGSYTKLVFKVPNERDDAATTKVEVNLPADRPLASVQTTPVPGWKVTVAKSKMNKAIRDDDGAKITEAVTKITWSGGRIKPGTFQEFPISVGPLPVAAKTMIFKTLQTYQDGKVVRWIEEPKKGSEEAENPAPMLTLVGGGHEGMVMTTGGSHDGMVAASTAKDSGNSSDGTARVLGAVGIVVGVIGTAIGVAGTRRRSGASSA